MTRLTPDNRQDDTAEGRPDPRDGREATAARRTGPTHRTGWKAAEHPFAVAMRQEALNGLQLCLTRFLQEALNGLLECLTRYLQQRLDAEWFAEYSDQAGLRGLNKLIRIVSVKGRAEPYDLGVWE